MIVDLKQKEGGTLCKMNKQSNKRFNDLINYIEDNLCEEISYKKLAQILGVNEYTMHRIFLFVTNYTLADYIRKRRLSMSALDLLDGKEKIIDIAIKYNYNSEYTFSRALKKEFGMGIEDIKKNKKSVTLFEKYDIFNSIICNSLNESNTIFDYEIITTEKMSFYGKHRKISKYETNKEARKFFYEESKTLLEIQEKEGVYVGIGNYNYIDNIEKIDFYIAGKSQNENLKEISIQGGKWVVFKVKSNPENQADDMYNLIRKVYDIFLKKYLYKLSKDRPSIEYYYKDSIEFWLSIDL